MMKTRGGDRSVKNMKNFQYASSWAPPSDGEDEMDLTRDIHPALRSQLAPPVTNSGRQYSQKPPPLPLVSVSKTTYDAAVSGARKTSTSHAVVNVRIDRSSKDLRNFEYASSWAPPDEEQDDLDLTRDVRPALQEDYRSLPPPSAVTTGPAVVHPNDRWQPQDYYPPQSREQQYRRPTITYPPENDFIPPHSPLSPPPPPPPALPQQQQRLLQQYPSMDNYNNDQVHPSLSSGSGGAAYVSPMVARAAREKLNGRKLSATAREFRTTESPEKDLYNRNLQTVLAGAVAVEDHRLATSWGSLDLGEKQQRKQQTIGAPPGLSLTANTTTPSVSPASTVDWAALLSQKQRRGRPICKIGIDIPGSQQQQQQQIEFQLHEFDDALVVGKIFRFILAGYETVDTDQWEASLISYIQLVRGKLCA